MNYSSNLPSRIGNCSSQMKGSAKKRKAITLKIQAMTEKYEQDMRDALPGFPITLSELVSMTRRRRPDQLGTGRIRNLAAKLKAEGLLEG